MLPKCQQGSKLFIFAAVAQKRAAVEWISWRVISIKNLLPPELFKKRIRR